MEISDDALTAVAIVSMTFCTSLMDSEYIWVPNVFEIAIKTFGTNFLQDITEKDVISKMVLSFARWDTETVLPNYPLIMTFS